MTAKMELAKPLLVTLAACFAVANIAKATKPYQTEAAFISSAVQVEIAPTVPKQLCEKIITNTKVRATNEPSQFQLKSAILNTNVIIHSLPFF